MSEVPPAVQAWLDRVRPAIEAELTRRLAGGPPDDPGRIAEAMRYATLGAGKRLRPALTLAACHAVGGDPTAPAALAAAAAIELCHAYSLVHDDLPAMDDDVERRGRPTVHVAFGEGNAILVGDALLTLAFTALADLGAGAAAAVAVLGRRAGVEELIAGQARDLALEDPARRRGRRAHSARDFGGNTHAEPGPANNDLATPSMEELERIHAGKTGSLFAAATELGGVAGGADAETRARLGRYGVLLGIAFQHADDRDDGELAALASQAAARRRALCEEAAALVRGFGPAAEVLVEVAGWIGSR